MNSRYTTVDKTWAERVDTLRQDLKDGDFGWFYFLLSLCEIDAYDSNDYDRREIIKKIVAGLKAHDYEAIEDGLDELDELG